MKLNNKQIRHLRQLAHHLKPVVLTGKAGISDTVIVEINQALEDHELIKVKISTANREIRNTMAEEISLQTGSETVQTIGHTTIVYRKSRNKKPRIQLP